VIATHKATLPTRFTSFSRRCVPKRPGKDFVLFRGRFCLFVEEKRSYFALELTTEELFSPLSLFLCCLSADSSQNG
jgi:hypothetical protein